MAAGIPLNFSSLSPVITTYDWLDISSGTGYRRYYATNGNAAGAATYFLNARQLYSKEVYFQNTSFNQNFDIEMKLPSIVYGDAFVYVPFGIASANLTGFVITVEVFHVTAGGVATSLGSTASVLTNYGAVPPYYWSNCLKVALAKKNFSKGDKLRLNVQMSNTSGGNIQMYCDPMSGLSRTDGYGRVIPTAIIFDCPFGVNL